MKSKNRIAFNQMAELFKIDLKSNCSNCGNVRIVVKFEDLPEAPKKGFKELLKHAPFKNGATFLNCKHCGQYSIVSSSYS